LLSARPGFEVLVGLLAVVFGLLLTAVVVGGRGLGVQSLLPLVFSLYGVIHLMVFTDIRHAEQRDKCHGG
jgi:hypothetical protein